VAYYMGRLGAGGGEGAARQNPMNETLGTASFNRMKVRAALRDCDRNAARRRAHSGSYWCRFTLKFYV
jgi:hypothetical protein